MWTLNSHFLIEVIICSLLYGHRENPVNKNDIDLVITLASFHIYFTVVIFDEFSHTNDANIELSLGKLLRKSPTVPFVLNL
jgi:hypothetical protein